MKPRPRPRVIDYGALRASLAALGIFGVVAALDEPTALDWRVYEWACRSYRRGIVLAGLPLEGVGLPGAYIPLMLMLARRMKRNGQRGGRVIVSAAFAGWLTVRVMRRLVWRPRPPDPPRKRNATESTFPSGHTTGVTTLALVAAKVLRDEQIATNAQALALGAGVPLLFGVNRVYVREHWLTDVLGGLALGTTVATGLLAVAGPRSRTTSSSRQLSSQEVAPRVSARGTSSRRSSVGPTSSRFAARPSGRAASANDRRV
jgi:undecaprenyl-diphosphatase